MLSQIFNQRDMEVGHLRVAQELVSGIKVLVVLDEMDSLWQLEEMANKHGWFGPGRYWKSPRHKNLSIGFSEEIQISRNAFDGMNNLQFLQVYSSNLRSFGRGIKPLHCLKLMDLTESKYLKEIPDLSEETSLREIRTQFLRKFDRAHKLYWQNATKLKVCRLYGCLLLKELPSSIGSGCLSLKKLNLSYTEIEKVPSSITTWSSSSCLYRLDIDGAYLKQQSDGGLTLSADGHYNQTSTLTTFCPYVKTIPDCIRRLSGLINLDVAGCIELVALPHSKLASCCQNTRVIASVSCRGEQNGLSVSYGSKQRDMPCLHTYEDSLLYTFEDSFCLSQEDLPQAGEATFSNLMFQFKISHKNCKLTGCGVRLLRDVENAHGDDGGGAEDEEVEVGDGDNDNAQERRRIST
uniref:NB-ARC domain-containing protein n=1 Tax=Brassica oleracea var. oleracea TaxID=109376 RepID=A0A0D3CQG8_BRAOL